MRPSLLSLLARFEMLVAGRRDVEERRRRLLFGLSALVCAPALAAYGARDLAYGHAVEGGAVLLLATLIAAGLLLVRRLRSLLPLFRIVAALALALAAYELATGHEQGYALVWHYVFPGVLFIFFGKREGSYWTLASFSLAVLLLAGGLTLHHYPTEVCVLFLVTYAIVAILAFGLEATRLHFHDRLVAEKKALERAVAQVKTLKRMLPICASCHKVRDDRGYWTMIEHYIAEHTDTEFSHGLCPECSRRLYPDFADTSRGGRHD